MAQCLISSTALAEKMFMLDRTSIKYNVQHLGDIVHQHRD